MAWFYCLLALMVGFFLGKREGLELGARAAFAIEETLVPFMLERDRARLKAIYDAAKLLSPGEIRAVAAKVGQIYAELLLEEKQRATRCAASPS